MADEDNIFADGEEIGGDNVVVATADGDVNTVSEDEFNEAFTPKLSTESPKAMLERKGQKVNADGRTLTVKEYFFTRPQTTDRDGNPIKPLKTLKGDKEYFSGKLGLRFEEDNIVEYVPTLRYFVNDGKMTTAIKLPRVGESQIVQLVNLVAKTAGKSLDVMSDKEILDFLVGKKVKIKTKTGTFGGKNWYRNDVIAIL